MFKRHIYGGDEQRLTNLNDALIAADGEPRRLVDPVVCLPDQSVEVVFRNHVVRLRELIEQAQAIVGCVAWLTHTDILAALAKKHVALIVQKEDFLRPDRSGDSPGSGFAERLRRDYARLSGLCRYDFPTLVSSLSFAGDPTFDPVRCVGVRNREKPRGPTAHHKFVLFCDYVDDPEEAFKRVSPYAVWTGSFNFTWGSTQSWDNAVVLRHPLVLKAYF